MFKHIATFSLFTGISRVLGLVRDSLMAFYLGAGSLSDVFFVAFRLPNLFRAFFAEGAFNIAFVPLYSAKIHEPDQGRGFATQTLSLLLVILLIFCLFLEVTSPYILRLFSPGFYEEIEKFNLTVKLSQIMLPYLLFISLASLIGGMLQVHSHFASTAGAPIILNLCLISCFFLPYFQTPAHNLAVAVIVAGVLQLLLMIFTAYRLKISFGITYKLRLTPDVKRFFCKLIPAIFSNCINQISLWVDTVFASLVPGAVSFIYYADRINQLPQAIIGTAIGTVLLPVISKHMRNNAVSEAIGVQNKTLEVGMMLAIPATAAMAILADSILLTLFSYGAFDSDDVANTAKVLQIFAFSLPAFVISKILLPTFYALGNTSVPALFALISLLLNVVLNFILVKDYSYVGIAIATTVSSWVNVILLIFYLRKKELYPISATLSSKLTKIVFASCAMMLTMSLLHVLLDDFFVGELILRVSALSIIVSTGIITYFSALKTLMGSDFFSISFKADL